MFLFDIIATIGESYENIFSTDPNTFWHEKNAEMYKLNIEFVSLSTAVLN